MSKDSDGVIRGLRIADLMVRTDETLEDGVMVVSVKEGRRLSKMVEKAESKAELEKKAKEQSEKEGN